LQSLGVNDSQQIKTIPNILGLNSLCLAYCNFTCIPNILGLQNLYIDYCQYIKQIPVILGLNNLCIAGSQSITKIPYILGLIELCIHACQNITTIPYIPGLEYVSIIECHYITTISYNLELQHLGIKDCYQFYNYNENKYPITHFHNINKIKKWYKKKILYIKKTLCIDTLKEFAIMYRMDPRRKCNKYLQNIIKEFSYT